MKCIISILWSQLFMARLLTSTDATDNADSNPTKPVVGAAVVTVTATNPARPAIASKVMYTRKVFLNEVTKRTAGIAVSPVKATASAPTKNDTKQIRDRVSRLIVEQSKAMAALKIAQQREQQLVLLEQEKSCYLKTSLNVVLKLVDNVQHIDTVLAADTCRERQIQQQLARTNHMQNRATHRLQVIRRLLARAEVGLVNMASKKELSQPNCRKYTQQSPKNQVETTPC